MEERRRTKRHMGEADIMMAEISEEKSLPEKLILAVSKDVSMYSESEFRRPFFYQSIPNSR